MTNKSTTTKKATTHLAPSGVKVSAAFNEAAIGLCASAVNLRAYARTVWAKFTEGSPLVVFNELVTLGYLPAGTTYKDGDKMFHPVYKCLANENPHKKARTPSGARTPTGSDITGKGTTSAAPAVASAVDAVQVAAEKLVTAADWGNAVTAYVKHDKPTASQRAALLQAVAAALGLEDALA